jgi:hypothetical protein
MFRAPNAPNSCWAEIFRVPSKEIANNANFFISMILLIKNY